MTLRIYNTLTRTKEEFKPLDPKNVRMYVCGPTVYDFAHIGNARPAIVFDVLYRLLRHLYGPEHVTYVRNITDVDDKINARALRDYPGVELNAAIRRVTETTYDQYQKDVAALGCLPPTHQPRATEYIPGMVDMIRTLITRGHAYEAAGEVLFDVGSMADYGRLSGRKLEDQQAGARVAVEAHKKNPGDFVLWKLSSAEEPGWDSPWGRGRPGWHIECSVMSKAHLGEVFDIHGGGLDLIFPHHENEIAQSRCAHGTGVMANYWMHNGFLQVEGKKMSKSDGNFTTITDVLKDWPGEVARLNMLRTHYRQPIDWTQSSLEETRRLWVGMGNAIRDFLPSELPDNEFVAALLDDLNTHEAFMRCEILLRAAQKGDSASAKLLRKNLEMLGFFQNFTLNLSITYTESDLLHNPAAVLGEISRANGDFDLHFVARHLENRYPENSVPTVSLLRKFVPGTLVRDARPILNDVLEVLRLETANTEARAIKNYVRADEIRTDLEGKNLIIRINKDGTTSWEVKR